ncbi:MAG TPA: alpha/beta hydrolase-fold protein [Planctomycetaceae bacterium]|jgi:enterochelin esterase-like enzyme
MGWQQVEIAGKRADVFHPMQPSAENFSVLFLHGHARVTLKDNAVYTSHLERLGLVCVCPHGQRSWWGDRVCREFDSRVTPAAYVREKLLPWMQEHIGSAPPAIALLGVSMGGQGALRLAYRFPDQFPIVAALAPSVDFQIWHGRGLPLDEIYPTAEAARQDTATLLLHPLHWPRHQLLMCDPTDADWFEGTERLASKLYSTGIPFDSDLATRHGGHSWDYFNHLAPRVMEFLHDRLQQESRRLPTVRD